MIQLFFIVAVMSIIFLPIVGIYIGALQVFKDDNNSWQKQNSDAYLIKDKH